MCAALRESAQAQWGIPAQHCACFATKQVGRDLLITGYLPASGGLRALQRTLRAATSTSLTASTASGDPAAAVARGVAAACVARAAAEAAGGPGVPSGALSAAGPSSSRRQGDEAGSGPRTQDVSHGQEWGSPCAGTSRASPRGAGDSAPSLGSTKVQGGHNLPPPPVRQPSSRGGNVAGSGKSGVGGGGESRGVVVPAGGQEDAQGVVPAALYSRRGLPPGAAALAASQVCGLRARVRVCVRVWQFCACMLKGQGRGDVVCESASSAKEGDAAHALKRKWPRPPRFGQSPCVHLCTTMENASCQAPLQITDLCKHIVCDCTGPAIGARAHRSCDRTRPAPTMRVRAGCVVLQGLGRVGGTLQLLPAPH